MDSAAPFARFTNLRHVRLSLHEGYLLVLLHSSLCFVLVFLDIVLVVCDVRIESSNVMPLYTLKVSTDSTRTQYLITL